MAAESTTARVTLERARYFLRQASLCGTEDRQGFEHNINAAIVFGRSVIYHTRTDYTGRPHFRRWFKGLEKAMKGDPLRKFFETRDIIVHDRPVGVEKRTSVSMVAGVFPMAWLVHEPQRTEPWYRRSTTILCRDMWRTFRRPVDRLRVRISLWRAEARAEVGKVRVTDDLYFDLPIWQDRPATSLVQDYLDKLERIVQEAEAKFASAVRVDS